MKRTILLTAMTLCLSAPTWAQKTVVSNEEGPKEEAFDVVEHMPEFPGGMNALFQFMGENMKYPEDAKKLNKQGRVLVTFVIDKDGSVVDAVVVKSVWPSLDAEALRVVRAMPKWTPGRQNGKVVRVKFTLPFNFAFTDEKKEE